MRERPVVYFHIGGHKTGTTYLQSVLWNNRAALRSAGVLYPGQRRGAHVWASHDLRRASLDEYRSPQVDGAWERLVDEIRGWGGSAIIDQELFSLARPKAVTKAVRDLDFADVCVVFTARDIARQLPAAWQEWIKNRSTLSFGEFLSDVRKPGTAAARRFMDLQDVPTILARWSAEVPVDRVRVITVPPPAADRGILWQRFASVIGIDPDAYDLTIRGANQSLGAAEAAVLRRVNAQLAERTIAQRDYDRLIKFGLAPALARRGGNRIGLPADAYTWAVTWAKDAVQELSSAGYPVTGDLAELIPSTQPTGDDPDSVGPDGELSAAITAIGYFLDRDVGAPQRRKNAPRTTGRSAGRAQRRRRVQPPPPRRRIRRRIVDAADRVRLLGVIAQGYRRLRDRRRPVRSGR